jgi:acyl-CoA reductase-like NAD-dependent aldehyde dehydrogenase
LIEDGQIRAIDPRNFAIVDSFAIDSPEQLPERIALCRTAQGLWAQLPLKERLDAVGGVLDRVVERAEHLAEVVRKDHGKSTTEAYFSEILGVAEVVRTHRKFDPRWLKSKRVALDPLSYPGKKARVEWMPRGLVGLITPWNYPLALPMRTLVPALIAGNGVLFKPSEHSLLCAQEISSLFAGLIPDGLLQVLVGTGDLGAALAASPHIDAVVFTGSVATGRKVAAAAAENLVPVSLELGGKDAAIVCADADLDRAAAGIAWGAFHNSGQNCAAIERLYVEDVVYDEFMDKLVAETSSLRTAGEPDTVEVGPLCNQKQFDLVQRQLNDALDRGAKVLCGGSSSEGWSMEPTILIDAPAEALVWNEETFGPLLPVARVHSVYEAVAECNASPFGLSASVWGRDSGRAEAIARSCDVGMSMVNNHSFMGSVPNSPWVGTGDSGYGVTGSELAMKFLARPQLVVIDKSKVKEIWWYPLNDTALAMVRTVVESLVAPLGRRISLTLRLLGLLAKRWG